MAFKLTQEQQAQITTFGNHLSAAAARLSDTYAEANALIDEARTKINIDTIAYNAILRETRDFINSLTDAFKTEYDEKSDGWQESDRGEATKAWLEEFDNLDLEDLDELDTDDLSNVSEPELTHVDELTALTNEPEE